MISLNLPVKHSMKRPQRLYPSGLPIGHYERSTLIRVSFRMPLWLIEISPRGTNLFLSDF